MTSKPLCAIRKKSKVLNELPAPRSRITYSAGSARICCTNRRCWATFNCARKGFPSSPASKCRFRCGVRARYDSSGAWSVERKKRARPGGVPPLSPRQLWRLAAPRSKSIPIVLWPSLASTIARFAAIRLLPTPPLPPAIGIIVAVFWLAGVAFIWPVWMVVSQKSTLYHCSNQQLFPENRDCEINHPDC